MNTFEAEVALFKAPHGYVRQMITNLPVEVQLAYNDMAAAGCRLEAELLRTDEVSVTIADGNNDLDIRVVPNGPAVQNALVEMLNSGYWNLALNNDLIAAPDNDPEDPFYADEEI